MKYEDMAAADSLNFGPDSNNNSTAGMRRRKPMERLKAAVTEGLKFLEAHYLELFDKPEKLVKGKPLGKVVNRGGPHGVDTAEEYYATAVDPQGKGIIALVKWMDGSPVGVRYDKKDLLPK